MSPRPALQRLLAPVLALVSSVMPLAPAYAAGDPVGIWTLSMPGTNRACRLQLRADATATGQAVAMPPGCRRAFPILGPVRSWSVPDGVHLALSDENGANVLMFDDAGDGRFQAAGPESEAAFLLTPLGTRRVASPAAAQAETVSPAAPAAQVAAVPAAPRAEVTVSATAGHYAVMRGSRDTGCMVTLDDAARGAQTALKARLAPACRDQGITIFDPVGWSLKGGHLVLAARRGHTAVFSPDGSGLWVKDAGTGQPLGLKRL